VTRSRSPLDICAAARNVRDLLDEFETATERRGAGTHRDPEVVLRDLRHAIDSIHRAICEARDSGVCTVLGS
jgi:hypothetical protein